MDCIVLWTRPRVRVRQRAARNRAPLSRARDLPFLVQSWCRDRAGGAGSDGCVAAGIPPIAEPSTCTASRHRGVDRCDSGWGVLVCREDLVTMAECGDPALRVLVTLDVLPCKLFEVRSVGQADLFGILERRVNSHSVSQRPADHPEGPDSN